MEFHGQYLWQHPPPEARAAFLRLDDPGTERLRDTVLNIIYLSKGIHVSVLRVWARTGLGSIDQLNRLVTDLILCKLLKHERRCLHVTHGRYYKFTDVSGNLVWDPLLHLNFEHPDHEASDLLLNDLHWGYQAENDEDEVDGPRMPVSPPPSPGGGHQEDGA